MRYLWPATVCAACLALAGGTALAQGEFPLKYVDAQQGDQVLGGSRTYVGGTPTRPARLKAPPKGLSANARFFDVSVGKRSVLAVLDPSDPPRLWVDAAGTGDLSGAQPLAAAGPAEAAVFGPVDLPGPRPDSPKVKARVSVLGAGDILMVVPAGYMAGEVTLGGRTYRVALLDAGLTGRYDAAMTFPREPRGTQPMPVTFAIDLNQDGRFDNNLRASGEAAPLMPMVEVKGICYTVKPAPDGTSLRLEKAAPKTGTLDIACADAVLIVFSESGWRRLEGSGGKWQVPAGKYAGYDLTVTRTDKAAAKWSVTDNGTLGGLANFEVRPGEALAMKVGPPLTLKVEPGEAYAASELRTGLVTPEEWAKIQASAPKRIDVGLTLVGQAGEEYAAGAVKGDARPPPPKVKVLDEAGKTIAQGDSEYG